MLYRKILQYSHTVKAIIIKALIRPYLEYASVIWDPHLVKGIVAIKNVQILHCRSTPSSGSLVMVLYWMLFLSHSYPAGGKLKAALCTVQYSCRYVLFSLPPTLRNAPYST